MIEFGKLTGKSRGSSFQVTMRTGEHLYAPMATMGTGVPIPSKKWLLENKDNFLALISYEKNIFESPLIVGFFPVKGADSSRYNPMERLIELVGSLLEQLLQAKVNTFIGPQPFMTDTIGGLNTLKGELSEIKDLIQTLKK